MRKSGNLKKKDKKQEESAEECLKGFCKVDMNIFSESYWLLTSPHAPPL